jgi:lipoprotein NlpD
MRACQVLLGLLLATGCAGARSAGRGALPPATPERPPSASSERAPHAELELVTAHAEPELLSARTHRVAKGETLYRIARTYGLSVAELSAANGLEDPRSLAVGQELMIPTRAPAASQGRAPAASEGRAPVGSKAPAGPVASRGEPEAPATPARPAPGSEANSADKPTRGTLEWPLRGVLYGRFGKKGREPHDGIDLAAPAGTPIKTAQEGTVLYAGEQRGYGLIVIIEHSPRLITLYAHNRDLRVRTGQKVRRDQVIATVGESGKTSGPQLHFEVRLDGKPVDPLDYLGPLPPPS